MPCDRRVHGGSIQADERSNFRCRLATALACAALVVLLSSPARAQSPDDLKNEVEALRRDYEARIKALEERLATLEKQQTTVSAKPEVSAIAPAAATQDAMSEMPAPDDADLAASKIGTTPRYDQIRDFEERIGTMSKLLEAFEFHGYFRSGTGGNGRGGEQVALTSI